MLDLKERLDLISKSKIAEVVKIHFLSSLLEATSDINQLKNELEDLKSEFVFKKKDFSVLIDTEEQVVICLELQLNYPTGNYDLR